MDTANSLRGESASVDGRTARRLANRERILDAALELTAQGVELDIDEIALRATVSVRSIYNHFPTARHLVAGMYERGTARMRHFISELPGPDVAFGERVKRFVRTWGRMQDELAPIRWQALVAEDRHPISNRSSRSCAAHTRSRSPACSPSSRGAKAQAAATALTDSLTWRALRRHQGLGFDAACGVVEDAIKRLAG